MKSEDVRNPRDAAVTIVMDLRRSNGEIHSDLIVRWPRVIDLNWELEDDQKSGWVYNRNRLLAKLVQS